MSDRTRLTEPAEAGPDAEEAATTRADRVMGRAPGQSADRRSSARPRGGGSGDGASGSGRSGDDRPGGARSGGPRAGGPRSGGGGSGGSSERSGDRASSPRPTGPPSGEARPATQRPTPVAGAAETADRDRPTDGWGRAPGPRGGQQPTEDETPTRVNPVVPTFRTPPREPSGPGREQGGAASAGSASAGSPGAAGAPAPAVGAGSLGTVTRSMEEPTTPITTEKVTSRKDDLDEPVTRPKPRKARRARLRLSRIDPWSVMKTSFLFSIALGIASWVAVAFVWWVIQQSGLFEAVNTTVAGVLQTPGDADPFRLETYVNGPRILGATAILAVVDVVLITAILTVASFLYNLSATMLGGLQLTLAETDD